MEKCDKKGIIVEPESTFESMMKLWEQVNELEDVNPDLGVACTVWFFEKLESIKDGELVKKIRRQIFPYLEQ